MKYTVEIDVDPCKTFGLTQDKLATLIDNALDLDGHMVRSIHVSPVIAAPLPPVIVEASATGKLVRPDREQLILESRRRKKAQRIVDAMSGTWGTDPADVSALETVSLESWQVLARHLGEDGMSSETVALVLELYRSNIKENDACGE